MNSTDYSALEEKWRAVTGWEGSYEVSSTGQVRSLDRTLHTARGSYPKKGIPLKPARDRDGYLYVILPDGVRKIHRLVCLAFQGEPPTPSHVVRHLNGVPDDNREDNLSWGTRKENTEDSRRHGTMASLKVTHCPRGHEYSEENTRVSSAGARHCRACSRIHSLNYYYRKKRERETTTSNN